MSGIEVLLCLIAFLMGVVIYELGEIRKAVQVLANVEKHKEWLAGRAVD